MKPRPKSSVDEPVALAANGWTFFEKCRCQHMLKYKYINSKHPGLVLEWWVKYSQFKITYRESVTKIPITRLLLLDKTLKEL